ncbi:DUF3019 domain-containing protein [Psychrosphaera sp. B3R10]|uniref:DUF3019 domain-containing protein n=1 Tax=Psychrosphaera algicola TaxID=3023714 RepID=A0ABT5FG53_9GAMM|nr:MULTISPECIES: DUF3019 domain-containing protein [unclassified Psychrosphaera]MBU2883127.1 DUF3019 domain-containing protein [Psychrosphaera sp. I2R16]MBU2988583.1 DUF3019 domain-containing protein [Psychrosphaera sp. B3R10]MDC2890336.1 DUF3019 domain-containing protein [Psychrosphaera sp. G1-22]MDO6719646.1 DUF3019 domain-containing protein [Psychrosphaera sp. 1_MG-2023]
MDAVGKLLCVFITLNSLKSFSADATFDVLPRVCLYQTDPICNVDLTISWRHNKTACLKISGHEHQIQCAKSVENIHLSIQLYSDTTIQLVDAKTSQQVDSHTIKLLSAERPALKKRRLSWSLF